jgi:2-polyprenyl-3-methyl-5-hydroxy-6-metoxy-1,4-benzoquinol methylase
MDHEQLHDVERRRRQREALFDPGTIECLERIGVAEGWRCLEVGAGYGSIADWLTDRAGPGHVTATDIRGEYLTRLRELLEGSATVLEHDVATQPLPAGEFDLVHARFVLEHLATRDAVVAKLAGALRQGGWLLIEDAEFSPCVAVSGAYGDVMAAFVAAMTLTGTDYTWSLRLPEVMNGADAVVAEAGGLVRFFAGGSAEAEFWASNWLDVRDRFKSDAPLEAALDEASDSRRWFPGPMVVAAVGRRPDPWASSAGL